MIIIQCECFLSAECFTKTWEGLVAMAKTGVMLLPPSFTLVNEVPPDTEVVVVREKERAGV